MEKQSTSKSFAILGTANIIVKILAIIYLPFQTAILGNTGNGIVAKGMAIYTLLFSFSNAGLPNAISKLVSEQAVHGNFKAAQKILKSAFVVLLGLGTVVALFMLIFSHQLAKSIFVDDDRTYLMLIALAPTLLFTSVSCALRGYFQGRQNMVPVAISNVIEQVLNSVLTVVFAWLLFNYGSKLGDTPAQKSNFSLIFGSAGTAIGTLIGGIGAAAFLSFVYFYVIKRQRNREIRHTSKSLAQPSTGDVYKQIFHYTVPAVLNTIATCAASIIDNSATKRLALAGDLHPTATFGIYANQFNRLFILAIAFSTALVTSMIPSISEAIALKNNKLIKHRISESYKAIYLLTIPSIAGITFLAQPMITLVFPTNPQGADLVIFGTWTAILMTIQYVQSGVLIASGKPTAYSVNLIIGMAVKILVNYILIAIPAINIKGAIIGSAVGWTIAIVLNQIAIKQKHPFKVHFIRMMIKPAFASLIMGVICLICYNIFHAFFRLFIKSITISSDIALLITVGIGAGVFFVIMILIKGVTKKDILRLPMGGRIYRYAARMPLLRDKLEG